MGCFKCISYVRYVQWNANNNKGEPVSAGMYIYNIQAGKFTQTKKIVPYSKILNSFKYCWNK